MNILQDIDNLIQEINIQINELGPAAIIGGGLLTAGTLGGVVGIPGVPNLHQFGQAWHRAKQIGTGAKYTATYGPMAFNVARTAGRSIGNKIQQHI
jgi:hypothetical protein